MQTVLPYWFTILIIINIWYDFTVICQDVHSARRYVDETPPKPSVRNLKHPLWTSSCKWLLPTWLMDIFVSVWKPCKLFISFYEWRIHSSSSCMCFFSTHLYFWLSNHYIGKRLLLFDDITCPLKTTFQKIDIFTPGELPFRFFFGRARFLHIAGIPRAERSWGLVAPFPGSLVERLESWNLQKSQNWKGKSSSKTSIVRFHMEFFQGVFFRFRCLESPEPKPKGGTHIVKRLWPVASSPHDSMDILISEVCVVSKFFLDIIYYSILFYSILVYSILFYSSLFYSIIVYSILFYSIIVYSSLFYSILF